jgi:hypothetical protein
MKPRNRRVHQTPRQPHAWSSKSCNLERLKALEPTPLDAMQRRFRDSECGSDASHTDLILKRAKCICGASTVVTCEHFKKLSSYVDFIYQAGCQSAKEKMRFVRRTLCAHCLARIELAKVFCASVFNDSFDFGKGFGMRLCNFWWTPSSLDCTGASLLSESI